MNKKYMMCIDLSSVLCCNVMYLHICVFFFFKQKTAYEMRISDWSSDVCSSDLRTAVVVMRLSLGRSGSGGIRSISATRAPGGNGAAELGRASCRERVGQYV